MGMAPVAPVDLPRRMSLRRAALATGIGRRLLAGAVARGELPAIRPGDRTILVEARHLRAWLESRTVRRAAAR